MDVREAIPADSESLRFVHIASITELGRDGYSQEQVDAWAQGCKSADYLAMINADESSFVVAEDEGDIVGFGSVTFDTPAAYETTVDAEITGVYVHPAVARQGVGSAIYAELERQACATGVHTLGLSATRHAVPFYEAHGYERVRDDSHEFSSHESTGVTGTVIEMKKEFR